MLNIYVDKMNQKNKESILEFHIDDEESFKKVKSLLLQLERCSRFADSSVDPFQIVIYTQNHRIVVKGEFLLQPDKDHSSFEDLLKKNGIQLHVPALKEKIFDAEDTPLIGETKPKSFLQKTFAKFTL